jgi:hypothetical protein
MEVCGGQHSKSVTRTGGIDAMMHPKTRIPFAAVLLLLAFGIGGAGSAFAQDAEAPATEVPATEEEAPAPIPAGKLESLVAPIALYPDDLLAQTLVAATYPLEIIQLQQWLVKNPDLKEEELAAALEEQPWDPAIKSMAAVPEVVERLANDVQWTTDLGNAFLAQQDDVLEAAQTMRKKAQQVGALESNEQMTVETQVVERDTVIIVETASPEVIYVPSYDPVVVYGPPVYYAYPPIYYPPPPPAGVFIAFSVGVMWRASYWGGPCCGCGWGRGSTNIYIHNSNNFYRGGNHGGGNWKHNPQHRGAAPYGDRATADRYGGRTKDTPRAETRPSTGTRDRGTGSADRDRAGSDRPATGDRAGSDRPATGDRAGSDRPATNDRAGQREGADRAAADRDRSGNRPEASRGRDSDRQSGSANRGGSDRVGNRDIKKSDNSRGGGGLGGGNHQSYDRNRAQNSHNRGQSSRGAQRGGGGGGRRGGRR